MKSSNLDLAGIKQQRQTLYSCSVRLSNTLLTEMGEGRFGFVWTYFVPSALMNKYRNSIYTVHGFVVLSLHEASHFPPHYPGRAHTWLNPDRLRDSSAD